MSRTHVVGAGLAGLAAALTLAEAGRGVVLHEAGPVAGGRCRSYWDRELGCRVDNGNHLLLSGNRAVFAYLDQMGARGTLTGPGEPFFPFLDLRDGESWVLRPNRGRVPWWLLDPGRRVKGTRARDYLALLTLRRAGAAATVAGTLPNGVLYRRLLEPLAVAALNTPADQGSAALLQAVVAESLAAGGAACVPCFPREGLSETLVDPAVAWLQGRGAELRTGRRVAGLEVAGGRVTALAFADERVEVVAGEDVLLAVTAPVAGSLLPGLTVPDAFEPIVNLHYRTEAPAAPGPVQRAGFIGLVGGTAEWVFLKPGVVSVTVSAAGLVVDRPASDIAATVWPEIARALNLPGPMPLWRVVKEKRATFAATPAQERRRPQVRIGIANLALAGDWTATGLPATIEGAIRSGRAAGRALLSG